MFEHQQLDGVRVICASGRLVAGAGADRRPWPLPAAGEAAHVVVDLRRVTAIDAAGVGVLLHLRAIVAARGARLTVAAPPPRVRRVLQLTGLATVFDLAPPRGAGPDAPWPAGLAAGTLCRCA